MQKFISLVRGLHNGEINSLKLYFSKVYREACKSYQIAVTPRYLERSQCVNEYIHKLT